MTRRLVEPAPRLTEDWTLGDLRCHWGSLVGPHLEHIARPTVIDVIANDEQEGRFGALVVAVKTPEWVKEFSCIAAGLLESLPHRVDGITVSAVRAVLDPQWLSEYEEWT